MKLVLALVLIVGAMQLERPLARAFVWIVAQALALVLTPLMWLPYDA